ncbi:MAG: cell division protein SepF [Candidatus Hadarchaeales archaeon]
MALLDKLLRKKKKEETPSLMSEVPIAEVETSSLSSGPELEAVYVKSMDLSGIADVVKISEEVSEGNILIIDISDVMQRNPEELKQAIEELKESARKIGGDIGKITDTKIIMTPRFVKILSRKEVQAGTQ